MPVSWIGQRPCRVQVDVSRHLSVQQTAARPDDDVASRRAERAWRRNGERRGIEELVDRGIRELDRRTVVVGAQRAVRSARDIRRVTGDTGRQRRTGQPCERRRGAPAAEDASPEAAVVQPAFVRAERELGREVGGELVTAVEAREPHSAPRS